MFTRFHARVYVRVKRPWDSDATFQVLTAEFMTFKVTGDGRSCSFIKTGTVVSKYRSHTFFRLEQSKYRQRYIVIYHVIWLDIPEDWNRGDLINKWITPWRIVHSENLTLCVQTPNDWHGITTGPEPKIIYNETHNSFIFWHMTPCSFKH